MKRNIEAIAAADYDVIVVGGGIHGSWVAHEAAQQGLSVCLLEKGDFGHATSANSLKIIHGGYGICKNSISAACANRCGNRPS